MAEMGNGYGSEAHMLRYLGRHRNRLDQKILEVVPAKAIHWLDFGFAPGKAWNDSEIERLDFLPDEASARRTWATVWPNTGTPITWDAIASTTTKVGQGWLLVEAKANIEEIAGASGAKLGGLDLIQKTLDRTKSSLGVPKNADWVSGYYQAANRIAVLHHLVTHNEDAHLLFLYFCGDRSGTRRTCPLTAKDWEIPLEAMDAHLQLPPKHPLSGRIHKLFLDVCPK